MSFKRSDIVEILERSICTVEFLKKDGTDRKMMCTLRHDIIPEVKGTGVKKTEDVISVFDMDKSSWRSFRVDSVTAIEIAA